MFTSTQTIRNAAGPQDTFWTSIGNTAAYFKSALSNLTVQHGFVDHPNIQKKRQSHIDQANLSSATSKDVTFAYFCCSWWWSRDKQTQWLLQSSHWPCTIHHNLVVLFWQPARPFLVDPGSKHSKDTQRLCCLAGGMAQVFISCCLGPKQKFFRWHSDLSARPNNDAQRRERSHRSLRKLLPGFWFLWIFNINESTWWFHGKNSWRLVKACLKDTHSPHDGRAIVEWPPVATKSWFRRLYASILIQIQPCDGNVRGMVWPPKCILYIYII